MLKGADLHTMALVTQGDYVAAASRLSTKETLQGDSPEQPVGTAISGSGGSAAASSALSPAVHSLLEPALFESFYPARRDPITVEALEANTLIQLITARWLLTALSAVGLATVGYLLFADKFVGTSGELMTAFFWGFTTDLGLDALISAATKKKTTET